MNYPVPSRRSLSRFSIFVWLTLLIIAVVVASFTVYVHAEKQIDRANEQRLQSFWLADELRQSSDELTRMVRTYVATGDLVYKQHFLEILAIRDGQSPRPQDYQNGYWYLVQADGTRPSPMGDRLPLLEAMKLAGFTPDEFAMLARAKANSDALTRTEFAAMALIEGPQPPSDADRLQAIRMVHDQAYHDAKAGIMRPIYELNRMADQRTLQAVHHAEAYATQTRIVLVLFGLFGLLQLAMLWKARRSLAAVLGGPVHEVFTGIARLGGGDFVTEVAVAPGKDDSVLGWLSKTRANLAHLDSERRQMSERLVAANAALEYQVVQRTADLQEALDMAKHASQAKSSFLSSMSHELRTPMNAIMGFSQLLLMKDLSQDQRRAVDEIWRAGKHLLALIDDLLDLTRIEAGQVSMNCQPVDLAEVTEDAVSLVQPQLLHRQLALVNGTPPGSRVVADPVRLRQVIVNLLSNAAKYNRDQGRIEIEVSTPREQCLRLSVRDTGVGMSAEQLPRLFKTFERLEAGRRGIDGTGIGLALARHLVELMGGSIGVVSHVNVGSTFWIDLPAHEP
ncbi:MAG: hypothetical protein KGL57_02650 [Burkholderiales bacterium]|nr:hypothetical protein [Burkholderiales bacterium]